MELVIGVVSQGRQHVSGTAGANGTHIFRIASISKVLTSLALASLVDRGQVGLDDVVLSHMPGFDLPTWREEPIRVRHLATHTSGLRDGYYPGDDGTVDGFAAALRGIRLASPPNAEYSYSNTGASLLGNMLALRVGVPFGELVRQLVCEPLGLDDTVLELSAQQAERCLKGYEDGRPVTTPTLPLHAASGGFYSSANDLMKLLGAHLSMPPIAAVAMVQQPWFTRDTGAAIALGWHIDPLASTHARLVWHNGSLAGYRSFVGFVPEAGCGVVALTNTNRPPDEQARRVLVDLVGSMSDS